MFYHNWNLVVLQDIAVYCRQIFRQILAVGPGLSCYNEYIKNI